MTHWGKLYNWGQDINIMQIHNFFIKYIFGYFLFF